MRRIAIASFWIAAALAVWLTFVQVHAGSTYRDDPRNVRALRDPDDPRRGVITTADGTTIAEDRDGIRTYPGGSDYLHLTGVATQGESTGLEATRSADLRPLDDGSITSWLITMFGGSVEPPEVKLTVVDALQRAAAGGLQGHVGAAVALDPRTGQVLAYASTPSVDPNNIVAGTTDMNEFLQSPASLDRASFRLLPSGSTFKLLVAAAALEQGMTPDTVLEDTAEYLAPGAGQPITNVSGGTCTGTSQITLRQALAVSCNTAFSRLAVELGGDSIADVAQRAGFNAVLPFELGAAISSLPSGLDLDQDPGALAQTGLGERDVRVTALQMAVITAAFGNGGDLLEPYVVDAVLTRDGSTLEQNGSVPLGRLVAPSVAADVVSMMTDVVSSGTGRAAARSDVTVAGKTGTAEGGGGPHSWFVALAPADAPTIAIAVVVEAEGTGGTVAAPIAARILEAWFDAP